MAHDRGINSSMSSAMPRGFETQRPIKHLIALIDGTWVSASNKPPIDRTSNLFKLTLYLDMHNDAFEPQITMYFAGIGSKTSGAPIINGIFATALPRDVERVYINICANFFYSRRNERCDKIYLFGFSRGAVVARLVAEIISRYGLLRPSQIQYFPEIWDDFIGIKKIENWENFRDLHCIERESVTIEFLGLFDTVLGNYMGLNAAGLKRIFFHDRVLSKGVRAAIHLLAVHETRALFRPVLFSEAPLACQNLEQIWMPGVHSDVGGGYPDAFFANLALLTMLDRVKRYSQLKILYPKIRDLNSAISSDIEEGRMRINDECEEYVFKIMRIFASYVRQFDRKDSCQFLHSIFRSLSGVRIIGKNGSREDLACPDWDLKIIDFDDIYYPEITS